MADLDRAWVDDWISACREACRVSRQHGPRDPELDEADEFEGTWVRVGGVMRAR